MIGFLIILTMAILSISCLEPVSAQSAVYVYATSEGGEFSFIGTGDSWEWDINVNGFDYAYTDLTNSWSTSSTVNYNYIGNGEIYVKVNEYSSGDEFYYFEWKKEIIDGNGVYTKGLSGGRSVTVENSTNVTGWIDYRVKDRKAQFLFDTSHDHADLTVNVHNGHVIPNATVILTNGAREVKWTDEDGDAEFTPHTGKYVLVIEAEGYDAMIVEDLTFEADKLYRINVNMTQCLASCGSPFCAPDGDSLIVFYKNKEPNMGTISPQGYVNYFANQLTTCIAGKNKCAIGTLERMSTNWGIYPDPELGVLLYECNFTKTRCGDNWCEWEITYEVRNFQSKPYNYMVSLIAGNTTTELNTGSLDATFSTTGREIITKTVIVNGCGHEPGCCGQMYLAVISERAE